MNLLHMPIQPERPGEAPIRPLRSANGTDAGTLERVLLADVLAHVVWAGEVAAAVGPGAGVGFSGAALGG